MRRSPCRYRLDSPGISRRSINSHNFQIIRQKKTLLIFVHGWRRLRLICMSRITVHPTVGSIIENRSLAHCCILIESHVLFIKKQNLFDFIIDIEFCYERAATSSGDETERSQFSAKGCTHVRDELGVTRVRVYGGEKTKYEFEEDPRRTREWLSSFQNAFVFGSLFRHKRPFVKIINKIRKKKNINTYIYTKEGRLSTILIK